MSGGTLAWNVSASKPTTVPLKAIADENQLETWIESDPTIVGGGLALLARQLDADGQRIDILALDRSGSLVVIELKKEMAYRVALAQVID